MKVIVDTNIWIDFLSGNPKALQLKSLATDMRIVRHIWVECELRIGNIPNSENFFKYYQEIPESIFVNYDILFNFIKNEKLTGKGYSFVDIGLYASAKMSGCLIWTNDKNLKALCESNKILFTDTHGPYSH